MARAYDGWAKRYDADPNRTREAAARALLDCGLGFDGMDVVEIGCGTGRHTEWLAARARRVVALDFSDGMLAQARARVSAPQVRFVRHDISTPWPLEAASADVLVSMLVLEHIDDLAPVFHEAARVLRPAGCWFLCELHPQRQASGRQAEFVDPDSGQLQRVVGFVHPLSEYQQLAQANGLAVQHASEPHDPTEAGMPRVLALTLQRREAAAAPAPGP